MVVDPTATVAQENELIQFLGNAPPRQWIAFLRWAAPEMIRKGDQRLLAEVVCREAQRRAKEFPSLNKCPSEEIASVLSDLGLKLEVAH